jgi:DNA-binding NarL/FixJ family response regulator
MARDTAETMCLARALKPDILVIDANLSDTGIPELVRDLRVELPALNLVALADTVHQRELLAAAGASYALLKGFLDGQLRRAVLDLPSTGGLPDRPAALACPP